MDFLRPLGISGIWYHMVTAKGQPKVSLPSTLSIFWKLLWETCPEVGGCTAWHGLPLAYVPGLRDMFFIRIARTNTQPYSFSATAFRLGRSHWEWNPGEWINTPSTNTPLANSRAFNHSNICITRTNLLDLHIKAGRWTNKKKLWPSRWMHAIGMKEKIKSTHS